MNTSSFKKELLKIQNLSVTVGEKTILNQINLSIKPGEIHAIMGPNGSGKSTLAKALAGQPQFEVTKGSVTFDDKDLLQLSSTQRAIAGLFLGFQYPIEIPGINNLYFLKTALNSIRKTQGKPPLDTVDFMERVKPKLAMLKMDEKFLSRPVNAGFSGGEKKKNDILQMLILSPKLAILDEIDSGLDIDALKTIAEAVNQFRNSGHTILLVTHYQRLLNYIEPDYIHVLIKGRIVTSGDKRLAMKLEKQGYGWAFENTQHQTCCQKDNCPLHQDVPPCMIIDDDEDKK
jgi:Fe-S cluster assembly ATP-binding protein